MGDTFTKLDNSSIRDDRILRALNLSRDAMRLTLGRIDNEMQGWDMIRVDHPSPADMRLLVCRRLNDAALRAVVKVLEDD